MKFDVDLFPDDLPQSFPIARKTVQRYKWEFSSPSVNMTATMLRFFNDTVQVNPANIYVSNIKLYESSKANETSKEYFYVRNAQGDIIGLVNGAGDQVVSYVYDTWGKQVSISGNLAGSIGELNPYRYRGYRFDSETGLYYLQSRYYNPEWGRFINADAIAGVYGEILSHNIFAYCSSNPSNEKDDTGFMSSSAFDEGGGGGVSYNKNTGNANVGGSISSSKSLTVRFKQTVDYATSRLKNGLQAGSNNGQIINGKGTPYPKVQVSGYGEVPMPEGPYTPNNSKMLRPQFTNSYKKQFKEWWINQGRSWPEGEVNIHHIKPLSKGGDNSFENLIPLVQPTEHQPFTNWWRSFP